MARGLVKIGEDYRYYDENGNLTAGSQVIRGQKLYFAEDGLQAKGIFVTDAEGNRHFYDPDLGVLATNKFIVDGDDWYYFDENGQVVLVTRKLMVKHRTLLKTVFKPKAALQQTLTETNITMTLNQATW